LGVFCNCVINSLRRLGLSVTEEEEEAYYAVWRSAAARMGVKQSFLPPTYSEWDKLWQAAIVPLCRPSPASVQLTSTLLDTLGGAFPVFYPNSMLQELCRVFVGNEVADRLELRPHRGWRFLFWLIGVKTAAKVGERVPFSSAAVMREERRLALRERMLSIPLLQWGMKMIGRFLFALWRTVEVKSTPDGDGSSPLSPLTFISGGEEKKSDARLTFDDIAFSSLSPPSLSARIAGFSRVESFGFKLFRHILDRSFTQL